MVDNRRFSECSVGAAQGIIVKGDLSATITIGDHQLDRITVPSAIGRVFMVIIRHHEAEIDVFCIINNLNRGGLVIWTGPSAATIFFKENVGSSGSLALRDREFWISENGHTRPLTQSTINNNGLCRERDRVVLL